MTIQYTWKINSLSVIDADNQADIVANAWVTIFAEEGDKKVETVKKVEFTYTGASFTPFDQLTETQVIIWVKDSLGAEEVAKIERELGYAITPPPEPVFKRMPWFVEE